MDKYRQDDDIRVLDEFVCETTTDEADATTAPFHEAGDDGVRVLEETVFDFESQDSETLEGSGQAPPSPATFPDELSAALEPNLQVFQELVRELEGQFLAWARCRVKSYAEDAVQNAFFRIWRNIDRFDPAHQGARAFCWQCLKWEVISLRRSLGRTPRIESMPEFDVTVAEDDEEFSEEWSLVTEWLEDMGKIRYKEVFYLQHFAQLSAAEIAVQLSIDITTVYRHKQNATRSLIKYLNLRGS